MNEQERQQLAAFLEEDLGRGDLTSLAVVGENASAIGVVTAGEPGIVAGIEECTMLAGIAGLPTLTRVSDGDAVEVDAVVLEIEGNARRILGVERTLLNLLSHMSGVATLTGRAVQAVADNYRGTGSPSPPRIAATRKTLPGLRRLEKKAVVIGGGLPHRFDLSEAILIKDNHLSLEPDVATTVRLAREHSSEVTVELEVESLEQAVAGAEAGADSLLLDNMSAAQVTRVVAALRDAGLRDRVVLEASGGITIATVHQYADTGVDMISMGSLTASAPHLDFSLHLAS